MSVIHELRFDLPQRVFSGMKSGTFINNSMLKAIRTPRFRFFSHAGYRSIMGPLLMISAAMGFAVHDCLIKLLGPSYRTWDIAFYRWGIGFVLLLIIFGRRAGSLFKTNDLKLMVFRSIITVNLIKMLREKNGPVAV